MKDEVKDEVALHTSYFILRTFMLPASIPLFPLPNVVLFPGVFLPLHVFEPRYRALTRDALAGDRIIGISLLQPGFERDYDGRPPIYPVGCAGVITHAEPLADGRFDIVLNGMAKFRVIEELPGGAYRSARIETLSEQVSAADRAELASGRPRLQTLLLGALKAADVQIPDTLSPEDLVHALCQYLQFAPAERQALLECEGVIPRAQALGELLEMQVLLAQHTTRTSKGVH
jgi:Lon protease-like protein